MGLFSGIGRIVKKVVRVAKGIVKGAIGTVKGALKGDPMAMASLAMMVYGGYQAGQFLFNKAALTGLKSAGISGVTGGVGAGSATGSGTVFQAFGGTYTGGGLGAVGGGGAGFGAAGTSTSFFTGAGTGGARLSGALGKTTGITNVFSSGIKGQPLSPFTGHGPFTMTPEAGTTVSGGTSLTSKVKSFFDPKGLATSGVKTAKRMAQGQGAMAYSQQQAALEKQESYYENYMNMSQQMFERFGGGYAPFSASSTPKYAMSFNQKRNSVPPSFKPYFQYAAGTSNFGAATNIIDAALNRSYITQYA